MAITPGTSRIVTQTNAMLPGDHIASLTLNPPSPVEIGRTVSGGVQDKAANGDELGATN
jgi:hypothetical protein|tara:strand:+ start:7873 stop:8049 length:177 start_codon:yes stop_codon:yes gene_type:complete